MAEISKATTRDRDLLHKAYHSRPGGHATEEPHRRAVLRASAAGLAGGAVLRGSQGMAAPGERLQTAIIDERFAESAAFAAEMRRRGVPVATMRNDVTPFYRSIHTRLKQGRVLIAGLTPAHALLSLEMMADATQMRIALRAEQRIGRSGEAEWRVQGPADLVEALGLLRGGDWGGPAARLVTACLGRWIRTTTGHLPCAGASPASLAERPTVWVLAPVIRT